MNDEEKQLTSAALRKPSERLNRRMDQLFAGQPVSDAAPPRRRSAVWPAVAAGIAGIAIGWWIRPTAPVQAPSPLAGPAVHYIVVQRPSGTPDTFDWTQYPTEIRGPRRSAEAWTIVTPSQPHTEETT
jgi:hypothetical protein